MKKVCAKCKKIKEISLFYRNCKSKDLATSRCIKCIKENYRKDYAQNKEKFAKWSKNSYIRNFETRRKWNAQKYKDSLTNLLNILGNKCIKCGITDKRILQLDHINGGGSQDRRKNSTGYLYYQKIADSILKGNKGFQLLCANCNLIAGIEKGYKKSIWN